MPSQNVPALVLIYDIRGFTAASKRLHTADLGAFATGAHKAILELFSAHPPTFVKNLGDGHLLLWETGTSPDPALVASVVDGARRARTAFAAFVAGQGAAGARLPKHVGLGVAFGEVSRSDDYYGVALNLAARLQNLARPEGMALDTTVFEAVAARDETMKAEFRRARVHLKGLGSTLVWVKRPFSWERLFGRLGRAAAILAVPAAYLFVADAGIGVPGGEGLRRMLDRREMSLFRPVRGDEEVRRTAVRQRHDYAERLRAARTKDGWILSSPKEPKQKEADVWAVSQAICGAFKAPDLAPDALAAFLPALAWPFEGMRPVEEGGVLFGWPAHDGMNYTEAEPCLWTVAALATALGHSGAIPAPDRPKFLGYLDVAQRAADLYRPTEDGGWNMFPRQTDLSHHNPYSTTLAFLALLETRAAGLPWNGSVERRDAMIRSTAAWLVLRFDASGPVHGWRGTPSPSDPISPGLTFQVFSELLRAEAEDGIPVPPGLLAEVPSQLEGLVDRSARSTPDAGESQVEFTTHLNRTETHNEAINFLWHPWAIDAASRWLARARARGDADPLDVVHVRRTLGHLVVDLGHEAFEIATSGYIFVVSETLYGLSAVPLPRESAP